jgi:hypothetical protein
VTGYEWTRKDGSKIGLHVGKLPGRKKPSVYVSESNEFCARITPLASCVDEQSANVLGKMIEAMAEHKEPGL